MDSTESSVFVHDWTGSWIASAKNTILDPRWDERPDAARILCWSNRACASITDDIRKAKYGPEAMSSWLPGEIVANGDAIQQQGKSTACPIAPSSCEWRVVKAKHQRLVLDFGTATWYTEKLSRERPFAIGCDLIVQALTLEPLISGGRQGVIEVLAPVPGDNDWDKVIHDISKAIRKIANWPAQNAAWKRWFELRSYCCDLRSAAVMTTHRAQGSTFSGVWICNDLSHCNTEDAVPLHYTALTRAARAVHVVRRQATSG
jgi:exodeoxyribonuclease-5